jgi:hypothetical protein
MRWVHLMGAWCLKGAPKGVIAHGGHREQRSPGAEVTGSWILIGAPCRCTVPEGCTYKEWDGCTLWVQGASGGYLGGVIAHGGSPGAGHRELESFRYTL